MRSNMSIIPSPVQTVYRAPLMPIQYLRKTPTTIAHSTLEPKIAPVRVARMTSPEPMNSAAQINEGPTRAKTASPTGGFLIAKSLFCICSVMRSSHQANGRIFAKATVTKRPTTANKLTVTVHVLSVSTSVNPLIFANIQKPLSFIQLPHWAPNPIAAAR